MGEGVKKSIVNKNDSLIVDSSEFEMIMSFVNFVRERERGVFIADIVTHKGKRFVMMEFTDKKKMDLKPLTL